MCQIRQETENKDGAEAEQVLKMIVLAILHGGQTISPKFWISIRNGMEADTQKSK